MRLLMANDDLCPKCRLVELIETSSCWICGYIRSEVPNEDAYSKD